jgi:hypothetical protein
MSARWLAVFFALAALVGSVEQVRAENGDLKFEFSTDPKGPKEKFGDLFVRPNTGQAYYLFLRNTSGGPRDVTVQLLAADGKTVLASAALQDVPRDLDGTKAVRVTLTPPPKPMPPAGAAPPAPMPATAAGAPMANPMTPPPPPGEELKLQPNPKVAGRLDSIFYIRAFDDRAKDKPANERDKPSENVTVLVSIRQPTDYVKPDPEKKILYVKTGDSNELSVSMKSSSDFGGADPCPVDLVFPVQRHINAKAMREGVFRKTIKSANEPIKLYAKNMPVRGPATALGTFYINIDGVPRAYVYQHAFTSNTEAKGSEVTEFAPNAIRVFEHDKTEGFCVDDPRPPVLMTRPRMLPLRVEPDTTVADSTIDVSILPERSAEPVDRFTRVTPREQRIWLEAPNGEGGVFVTTRMGDWVLPLDLRDLRGRYTLRAALMPHDKTQDPLVFVNRTLVVDDTKPEKVTLEVLPGRTPDKNPPEHLRTKPLPVRIKAEDPESGISRVVVFFGKVGPDGKLPEAIAEATSEDGITWVADVPLPAPPPPAPPPPPGTPILPPPPKIADVTCIAVNGVGIMSEPVSMRIQLLDPPTGGIIKGTVRLSKYGKPLTEVKVLMIDTIDGKEKGATKTDEKTGQFVFNNVFPGSYRLVSARPDAGVGTKGFEDVEVHAGEEKTVTIILTRRP